MMAASTTDAPVKMANGRISIGPIRLPRGWRGMEIMRRMEELSLSIHREDDAKVELKTSLGHFGIVASGPGVLGYLVDKDNLDVDDSCLEIFAQPLIGGLPFVIEGEHELRPGLKMRCRTTIEACKDSFWGVCVSRERELVST